MGGTWSNFGETQQIHSGWSLCWCWTWTGPLRTGGRFWGKTSLCLASAVSNWFLILLDGLKRSLCLLPGCPVEDLWTPKYRLSPGQKNSSNFCIYFQFSWFRIAVPCWDGRPWHLLLSWITQVSLQRVPELSPARWWIHLRPHKPPGCSHSMGMDGSVVQETKGRVGHIDFGLLTSPPLLG